jgi:kinesin family protein 5
VTNQIFSTIEQEDSEVEYVINCSMLEIYKENLYDLLHQGKSELKIKESPVKGIYVHGLSDFCVGSEEELFQLISTGTF